MPVAFEKLHGLDREKVLAAVEPVLLAHRVEGVELIWGTDSGGWALKLTIERPESRIPGAGVTIDLCSDISRDLSAALDASDAIPQRYHLEVGSPGLDRELYAPRDYARFAGQLVKLKLRAALDGQRVLRGNLLGLNEAGHIEIEGERGIVAVPFDDVESGSLVFDFGASRAAPKGKPRGAAPRTKASRAKAPGRPQGEP